jgi:hypothetical protein
MGVSLPVLRIPINFRIRLFTFLRIQNRRCTSKRIRLLLIKVIWPHGSHHVSRVSLQSSKLFTLTLIFFTLLRIRIPKMMRVHPDPNPQHFPFPKQKTTTLSSIFLYLNHTALSSSRPSDSNLLILILRLCRIPVRVSVWIINIALQQSVHQYLGSSTAAWGIWLIASLNAGGLILYTGTKART